MWTGFRSLFKGGPKSGGTPDDQHAAAWVKLLVKLCAHVEAVEAKVDRMALAIEEDRHAGERIAVEAYRECLGRITEWSLGVTGQPELAAKMRAFAEAGDRNRNRKLGADLGPPIQDDEDEWPPKGCVTMDSRG